MNDVRLTFRMPTRSDARTHVSILLGRLTFADAEWEEGDGGATFLYVTCPAAREFETSSALMRAHPMIAAIASTPLR